MTELQVSQPRALLLRRHDQQESLNSLNQWVITLKKFYRRCAYCSYFLRPNVTWSSDPSDRGFPAETDGLKRTPEVLSADLEGFLNTLAGYLPFDYVADKLCSETTSLKSVWQVIYEIYDLEISTTNFLDYATMCKNQDESYRGFYNRLVGFVRQHLPQDAYESDGVRSPASGEWLSIGLLDAISIHLLLAIDRWLVSIVKTELATDLKTKRICQLVKQIAPNIDEWLQHYSQADTVNTVSSQVVSQNMPATNEASPLNAIIQRLERLESGARGARTRRGRYGGSRSFKPPTNCGHCVYINRQLGANLDVHHSSQNCPRKQLSVNILETLEQENNEPSEDEYYEEGEKSLSIPSCKISS